MPNIRIPNNREHMEADLLNMIVKELEAKGWTSKRAMKDDGLHVYLTAPGKDKPTLELSDM